MTAVSIVSSCLRDLPNNHLKTVVLGLKQHLNYASGFFSYVLINKSQSTIEGGRDTFGQKPLYYYIDNAVAIFASEEKAIKDALDKSITIDEQSVAS